VPRPSTPAERHTQARTPRNTDKAKNIRAGKGAALKPPSAVGRHAPAGCRGRPVETDSDGQKWTGAALPQSPQSHRQRIRWNHAQTRTAPAQNQMPSLRLSGSSFLRSAFRGPPADKVPRCRGQAPCSCSRLRGHRLSRGRRPALHVAAHQSAEIL
jgi:hypothetical protein